MKINTDKYALTINTDITNVIIQCLLSTNNYLFL